MKKAEVVPIPLPAMGHKVAVVEIAKLLVQRDDRIYTTVLVMHPTVDPSTTTFNESLAASTLPDRMRVINLPRVESITSDTKPNNWLSALCHGVNFSSQKQTSHGSLVPLDSAFPSPIHSCFAYE